MNRHGERGAIGGIAFAFALAFLPRPAFAVPAPAVAVSAEVNAELHPAEQLAFAKLRARLTPRQDRHLVQFLGHLPEGARGAFAGQLLKETPSEQANMAAFLALLAPDRLSALAERLGFDKQQWGDVIGYLRVTPAATAAGTELNSAADIGYVYGSPKPGHDVSCTDQPADCTFFVDSFPVSEVVQGKPPSGPIPWQVEIYRSGLSARPYTPLELREEREQFGERLADYQRSLVCGGVLLPHNWVLTAAHCVKDNASGPFLETRRVRTGTNTVLEGGTTWRIIGAVVNAAYGPDKRADLALLKIAADKDTQPATNGEAGPIGLPPPNSAPMADGTWLSVTGWGVTQANDNAFRDFHNDALQTSSALMEAHVKTLPLSACNSNPNFAAKKLAIGPGQICALGEDGQDTCQGDSGGPLIRYYYADARANDPLPHAIELSGENQRAQLVGLVSFGPGCGLDNTPGVYTDVAFYRGWILGALRQMKPGQTIRWSNRSQAGRAYTRLR